MNMLIEKLRRTCFSFVSVRFVFLKQKLELILNSFLTTISNFSSSILILNFYNLLLKLAAVANYLAILFTVSSTPITFLTDSY